MQPSEVTPVPVLAHVLDGVRASDAERKQVIRGLGRMLTEGRIDVDEHSCRMERVLEAETVEDLQWLCSDLPIEVPYPLLTVLDDGAAEPTPAAVPQAGKPARVNRFYLYAALAVAVYLLGATWSSL